MPVRVVRPDAPVLPPDRQQETNTMERRDVTMTRGLADLWRTDRPLTAAGLGMLVVLGATLIGLWMDPRIITGAPAWLKPAKFAASIAIYTLTLAWAFTWLPAWTKTRRTVSTITVGTLVLEMAVIALQAWRGTTSHFNVGTLLDGVLFTIMGAAILVQTLGSVAVAVALWRQPFDDRVMGWALRLGLTITIIGASSGGLMTVPTQTQLAEARATRITVAGAHTVGAPDGSPGLPGTGWSLAHGDLRVAHFLGLHAFQVFPLLALLLGRMRRTERDRVRLVAVAAASYVGLFAILIWQALQGQSIAAPDGATLTVLGGWALLTAAASWLAAGRSEPARAQAIVC